MELFGMKIDMGMVSMIALTVATGGAAAPALLEQMVFKAVVQMAIQELGQELGLPPALIQMATTMAMGQMGGPSADFGNAAGNPFSFAGTPREFVNSALANASPFEQGNAFRAMQGLTQAVRSPSVREAMENSWLQMNLSRERNKMSEDIEAIMNGKGSLLMKLAVVLGKIADSKMEKMAAKTREIGNLGELDEKNNAKYSQLSGEIQALGQEMSIVSQAMNNVIKTIGEATSTLARKG